MPNKLKVDPEFRDLCPSLSDDEKALLRESLVKEGCRDPIVCWKVPNSPIIDGHNRYDICTELKIPFNVRLLPFEDRSDVKCWILRNQLGRRNLTDAQRSIARGRLYNELKGEKHQNMPQNPGGTFCPTGNTAEAIADAEGVSAKTVQREAIAAKAIDNLANRAPKLKEAIEQGAVPLGAAPALAATPIAELRKLEKLEGQELKQAVRDTVNPPEEPEPKKKLKDAKGRAVPEDIVDQWLAATSFEELARDLNAVLRRVKEICEDKRAGAYMDLLVFEKDIKNLKHALKFARPYVVCRFCGGTGCAPCRKTGWMPESPTTRNGKES